MDSKHNQIGEDESDNSKSPMQILEEGLTLCKFGRFQLKLLFATFCSTVAVLTVNVSTSYVLLVADCYLEIDIMQKGVLSAMAYLGQVSSSLFAGFLTDAFGRKTFLVGGNALIFLTSLVEGSSQTYLMLVFVKVIQGLALSSCYTAMASNLTESCHSRVRNTVLLTYSSFMSVAMTIVPFLGWAILPHQIDYLIWPGYFEIHSWNIFLYACSIWSLLAFIIYSILPESPKYLLSQGREQEALEVLKTIYSENTRNKRDTFPITSLNTSGIVDATKKIGLKQQLVTGLFGMKELFRSSLLINLFRFSLFAFVGLNVMTSMIFWFPQISLIVETYRKNQGETAIFCVMIDYYRQQLNENSVLANSTESYRCVSQVSDGETYTNGVILGITSVVSVVIVTFLINYIGQKILMYIVLILTTACLTVLYWTNKLIQIAILISSTSALMLTALSLQQNIYLRYFPTTVRGLAASIIIMFGRLGAMVGNILFPVLLQMGCMVPFGTAAVLSVGLTCLTYFLPNVKNSKKGDK